MNKYRILSIILLCVSLPLIAIGIFNLVGVDEKIFLTFPLTVTCLALGAVIGFVNFFILVIAWLIPLTTKAAIISQESIMKNNKAALQNLAEMNSDIAATSVAKMARIGAEAMNSSYSTNKFCRYCGASIEQDSVYCPKCGAKL